MEVLIMGWVFNLMEWTSLKKEMIVCTEVWDSDRTLGNAKLRTKNRWEGGTQELIKGQKVM